MRVINYMIKSHFVVLIAALVISINHSCSDGDIGDIALRKLSFQDISIYSNGISYLKGSTFNFGLTDIPEPITIAVELKNSGDTSITIYSLTISGTDSAYFSYSGAPAGVTLLPGGSYSMNLIFTPLTAGVKNAQILISSSDKAVPVSTVNLTGDTRQWKSVASGVSAASVSYPAIIFRGGGLMATYLNESNLPYIYNHSNSSQTQLSATVMHNSVRSTYLSQFNDILYCGFIQGSPTNPLIYRYQTSADVFTGIVDNGLVSADLESVNGDIFMALGKSSGGSSIKLFARVGVSLSFTEKYSLIIQSGNISMCKSGSTLYLAYSENLVNRVTVVQYTVTNPGDGTGNGTLGTPFASLSTLTNNNYLQIRSDEQGVVFVAYAVAGGTVNVRKFNGVSWDTENNSAIISTDIYFAVNNGIPYIAYVSGGSIHVTRYIDSSWKIVGSIAAVPGPAAHPFISFYNGTLYLAYKDNVNGGRLSVLKYE